MQTATVTEISWNAYMEARKASHLKQVRRVRESLLRRGDAGEENVMIQGPARVRRASA